MNLQDYTIKNTTKCDCGHEFTLQDIDGLKRIDDDKFYGGAVKHLSDIKCPECKKETLLFLKQKGQTWKIIGIAQKDTTIANNSENISNKEFICDKCGKAFKSKSGLSSHLKNHEN